MAKKKRVTLPKNFDELIKLKDMEKLKAVYESCELHASYDGRYGMNTALHHWDAPEELIRWLVEQGLDVNIENYYGRTPLYQQAVVGSETVNLLFELGGDIHKTDRYGNSPLHAAAGFFHPDTVRFLLENGADVHAENDMGQTPLAASLSVCRNIDIPAAAEIASMLLQAGDNAAPDMLKSIKRIGEEFEFHRADFNKDYLDETEAGLKKLYALFDAAPAARRQIHDGVSPITVADGSLQEQYEALWNLLVPSKGAAKTVQGEVIRISGRVQDELYRNGGVNWDRNYRKMLNALLRYFASGIPLPDKELKEAADLSSKIHADGSDEDLIAERLCELSVQWVLSNPEPKALEKPDYSR